MHCRKRIATGRIVRILQEPADDWDKRSRIGATSWDCVQRLGSDGGVFEQTPQLRNNLVPNIALQRPVFVRGLDLPKRFENGNAKLASISAEDPPELRHGIRCRRAMTNQVVQSLV